MDLCDYRNKTFSANKVDDNYHTGEFGLGVHVSKTKCNQHQVLLLDRLPPVDYGAHGKTHLHNLHLRYQGAVRSLRAQSGYGRDSRSAAGHQSRRFRVPSAGTSITDT